MYEALNSLRSARGALRLTDDAASGSSDPSHQISWVSVSITATLTIDRNSSPPFLRRSTTLSVIFSFAARAVLKALIW